MLVIHERPGPALGFSSMLTNDPLVCIRFYLVLVLFMEVNKTTSIKLHVAIADSNASMVVFDNIRYSFVGF